MDFWTVMLLCAFLAGIFGWCTIPVTHCYMWVLNWYEGDEVNWGYNTVLALAVPCSWIYAILLMVVLFAW